jgi:thiopurine S-methyltransferase
MDANFWHERWALGEIGFHRSSVHWALEQHWRSICASAAPSTTVLVPLCGKTLDIHHLVALGHRVHGIELNDSAVMAFFSEAGWVPTITEHRSLRHYVHGPITITQGDLFDFVPDEGFDLLYDRAALVALPATLRPAYLDHLARLMKPTAQGLLVTMEYDQNQRDGPPFSVEYEELSRHPRWVVDQLERRDVAANHPNLVGNTLSHLHESVYRIQLKPTGTHPK